METGGTQTRIQISSINGGDTMYTLTFLTITALMFFGAGFMTARNIYKQK